MAEYEWIKKLTKDADKKKKGKDFGEYVDKDKFEEVKKSTKKGYFEKLKERLKGK
jgi:hypothetical protein